MNRDKVLPPKLSIKIIQDYLDMKKYPLDAAHEQLCEHVNNEDFNLYVKNKKLNLYETNDVTSGNGTLMINANAKPIKGIMSDLIVKSVKYEGSISLFDKDHNTHGNHHKPYFVEKINDQGIEYYITKKGTKSIGVTFSEDSFYSLRDEIINYRKHDFYKDTLDKNLLDAQFLDNMPSDDTPPYLDQESEFYSEELDLAIQVHKAIHLEKYGNPHLTREDNVKSCLDENRPELMQSDAMIRRIASIISLKRIKRK